MLQNRFLNVPLWVWLIITIYILYNVKMTCNTNPEKFSQPKVKIYNFNTSWCGWSKKFQPEWDRFTELCRHMDNVEVYDIKCDIEENKNKCKDFNIPGYPTIIAEVDNKKLNYNGERKSEKLVEFVTTL